MKTTLGSLFSIPTDRRAFFSFHYDDIMKVNVVRNSQEFKTGAVEGSFTDRSLWESRRLEGEESLKSLIRGGMANTSVTCVLAGAQTWNRRWVRYEIARSVIDRKGLLTVDIGSIGASEFVSSFHPNPNPLDYMGVYYDRSAGRHYLYEKVVRFGQSVWDRYGDFSWPIDPPPYVFSYEDRPRPLSMGTARHAWTRESHALIGSWINQAAEDAGR